MEFQWSEESQSLRDAAVEFATSWLAAGTAERDRDGTFSKELWEHCARFGLQGVLVPPQWGGGGYDLLSAVAVLEGVGYGGRDNGLIFSVAAHAASCASPIAGHGSPVQQDEWLPRLASGSAVGATGITEPGSGSSALEMRTTATRSGDGWVLDGTKTFVTNAPVADLFLVYARTSSGFGGVSCFLLSRETEGLAIGPSIAKMGLRTSPMAEVFLDGCRVSDEALLGGAGSGALVFTQAMEVERLLVMAPAIGVMQRLVERCTDHARTRKAGTTAIGRHQAVAHRIADMEVALESSRLLLYRAAWLRSHKGVAMRESAIAKLAVSEAYVDCCRSAMQIFGGYGYSVEYEIERELRDALAATLYVGTSEIQRNLIAGLRGLG
jgi:alkylation response protein AidB-like acyl-CoA dehydrogenase